MLHPSNSADAANPSRRTNIITVENPCEYQIDRAKPLPVASTTSLGELSRACEQAISAALRTHPAVSIAAPRKNVAPATNAN